MCRLEEDIRMENADNRRVKLTKKLLKDALIDIMRQKNIGAVTVKELCEKADMNRSTFYNHYETVNDLYNDVIADVCADLAALKRKAEEKDAVRSHRFVESVLEYFLKNRELFLVLLSDRGQIGIGEAITNMTEAFIDRENASGFSRYCTQFIIAGMSSLVWMWLNDDDALPAHDMALLINMLLNNGMKKAMVWSLDGNAKKK